MKKLMFILLSCFALALVPAFFVGCSCSKNNKKKTSDNHFAVRFIIDNIEHGISYVDPGEAVRQPEDPIKIGYNFDFWYTNEDFAEIYDFSKPVNKNITLYANFYDNKLTMYGPDVFGVASVNKCDANATSVVVPAVFYGAPVQNIRNNAFENCASLESVVIPSSVTNIGNNAFYGCTKLTSVAISEGLVSVGTSAFANCSRLQIITIPKSVKSMGNYVFSGCTALKTILLPAVEGNTLTNIFGTAKASITNVYVTNGYLKENEFYECTNLNYVEMRVGVTSIASHAFYNCDKLKTIVIDSSVDIIENHAFYSCDNIEAIYLPLNENINFRSLFSSTPLTLYYVSVLSGAIKKNEFSNWDRIETVVIGDDVTSIGDNAFYSCTQLNSVSIGSGVTSIGEWAFYNCDISTLTIPANVKSIGNRAFYSNENLSNLNIANGIESIGIEAFAYCSSLTNVVVPNSVTSMDYGVFGDCTNLTGATLPSNWTEIPANLFLRCENLISVAIPNGVESIGMGAFYDCTKLSNIIIPANVESIGSMAFNGCTKLTSVTILSEYVYLNATTSSSLGRLLNNATTIYVAKSVDNGTNAYLNGYFTKHEDLSDEYYVYTIN